MVLRVSRRDVLIVFGVTLVFVALAYSGMIERLHFSVDSYKAIFDQAAFWYLQTGRYINCFIILGMEAVGFNAVLDQRLFLVLLIISIAISIVVLASVFARLRTEDTSIWRFLLFSACIAIAFVNVFYMELILFPEMACFLAVGNVALSFSVYTFFFRGWGYKLVSLLLLLVALGTYQSYIGFYIAFCFVGSWLLYRQDGNIRRLASRIGQVLLFSGIGSVFNIVLVKFCIAAGIIVDSGRGAVFSLDRIASNALNILEYQGDLLSTADGLLPVFILPLFLIVLCGLMIYLLKNTPLKFTLLLLVLVGVSYVVAFAPHLIESNFLLTPRSNVAFWAVLAAVCLVIAELGSSKSRNAARLCRNVLLGSVLSLLAVSIVSIQDMATDVYVSNEQDRNTAMLIDRRLDEYEESTGTLVTKIAMVYDKEVTERYPGVRYQIYELNRKIMITPYSYYHLINYIGNRHLSSIEMPESIRNEKFAEKDWNFLDLDEQLVIEDDTAYLAVY